MSAAASGDSIYLGSGPYSGSFTLATRVNLIGVGSSKPVISPTGTTPGITVSSGLPTTIQNVAIALPATSGATGIAVQVGGATLNDVDVTGGGDNAVGISLAGNGPELHGASIDLTGSSTTAVSLGTSTGAIVDDVSVEHAASGVGLSNSQNFRVRRMVASVSSWGVNGTASSGTVSSSVFVTGATGWGASIASGGADTLRFDNNTFIGGGGGTFGLSVAGGAVSLTVDSNVFYNYGTAASAAVGTYSHVFNIETSSDPGFVNLAGGDYRPALNSSMIDSGDPAPLNTADSGTDAGGGDRVVSRGAGQVRDVGAYEAQNSPPVPRITVKTAVPSTTSATIFSAETSTDADGDAMTFSWKFDGALFNTGAVVQRMFIADGPHAVELTATDITGASATTSSQFNVAPGFLTLKLRSQSARLSKHGTFSIKLTCPNTAASNCTGRLLFSTVKKVNAKRYQDPSVRGKSAKAKILRAASYVFTVEPGVTRKLTVRTYGTFQNVLAVHKKFVLQSTLLSGSTSNATLTANRTTFTISAPKKKR